jgi:hypothetical protein
MTKQNILSIAPRSKHIGYAIFIETELREWGIKSLPKASMNDRKEIAAKLIKGLIAKYQINVVVLKQLHPSRTSKNLSKLVVYLKSKVLNGFVKHEYSINDIKQFFFPNEKTNKKCIMEKMVELYPFLYIDLEKEKRNKNRYFIQMFEAVALGNVHLGRK